MHELDQAITSARELEQAITYGSVWLLGALAALARSLRESDYRDFWRACGSVACGGFIAFSVVGIAGAHIGGHFNSREYSLAVAVAVGLGGQSLDSWLRWLVALITRIKLPDLQPNKNDKSDQE